MVSVYCSDTNDFLGIASDALELASQDASPEGHVYARPLSKGDCPTWDVCDDGDDGARRVYCDE